MMYPIRQPPAPQLATPGARITRSVSRKLSRDYSLPGSRYSAQSQGSTDANGAGPSGVEPIQWDAEGEVPTLQGSEYPDQFDAPFLPGYIEKVHDDPNASRSLGLGVPIEEEEDYTAPPPPESYEPSIADSRYRSVDSGASLMQRWNSRSSAPEQWNSGEGGTMMSACLFIMGAVHGAVHGQWPVPSKVQSLIMGRKCPSIK